MATTPEKAREHYLKNRDKYLLKAKQWALDNPDRVKEISRKWQLDNPDRFKQHQLKYRKSNPKKFMVSHARRRALKVGREFTITWEDLPDIPQYCPLLGIEINVWAELSHRPSIDRIDSSLGYIPGNVQIISQRANMLKNNATGIELLCLAVNLLEMEGNLE